MDESTKAENRRRTPEEQARMAEIDAILNEQFGSSSGADYADDGGADDTPATDFSDVPSGDEKESKSDDEKKPPERKKIETKMVNVAIPGEQGDAGILVASMMDDAIRALPVAAKGRTFGNPTIGGIRSLISRIHNAISTDNNTVKASVENMGIKFMSVNNVREELIPDYYDYIQRIRAYMNPGAREAPPLPFIDPTDKPKKKVGSKTPKKKVGSKTPKKKEGTDTPKKKVGSKTPKKKVGSKTPKTRKVGTGLSQKTMRQLLKIYS